MVRVVYYIWNAIKELLFKDPLQSLTFALLCYVAWKLFYNHLHHILSSIEEIKNQTTKNFKKICLVDRKFSKLDKRMTIQETKCEERTKRMLGKKI